MNGASNERPLRVLLVANDGLSAGHVARMIAIADGLARVARDRDVALRTVLATTSQAHALLAGSEAVVVQLPAPAVARRAGFSDTERRRLVSGAIEGVARALAPDLVVVDTFPLGPHRELAGIDLGYARRALVRRHVPAEAQAEPMLADGLELVDLAILADDPTPIESSLACRCVHVPPITIERETLPRAEARRALGLPSQGRVLLVAAGGGGDEEATQRAQRIARAIEDATVALALGPLAGASPIAGDRVIRIHAVPLSPYLPAFDGAVVPAGYNTAHELARAGVPSVLFAQARPYDDQAARARRFGVEPLDDEALAPAIASMKPLRAVPPGGARRAAEALLDLAMGRA